MKYLTNSNLKNGCILLMLLFLFSCKKDDSPANPTISKIPEITLLSVSPTAVHNLSDSLLFIVGYVDGDGDLGDYEADSLSLWITDNRFPLTEKFHIIPLAPQGTSLVITGELKVLLEHIMLKDQSSVSETATFTVQLKDRAGHWSNTVTSETITILQ
ncbi:MAG: hypothetical protein IPO83_19200 [Chitinophagaceae bacterium]|nr:hypothetical protein [Chitinophagaceae bacterium]